MPNDWADHVADSIIRKSTWTIGPDPVVVADRIAQALRVEREAAAALLDAEATSLEADLPSWREYLGEGEEKRHRWEAERLRRLAREIRERGSGDG